MVFSNLVKLAVIKRKHPISSFLWSHGEEKGKEISIIQLLPFLLEKGIPTPVFLPGDPCGQRSLAGYSPWGCKELDTSSDYAQHIVESARACPCQNAFHDMETESNCWAHLCNFKTILFS